MVPHDSKSDLPLIWHHVGKDAKRGILLDEECQVDIESAFLRETVAKKYASLFHSTLHHNTGYFLQVISLHFIKCKIHMKKVSHLHV